jgi:hypothetical protein
MPVLEQISEASDKFFDVAESTNERAHEATKTFVIRFQDTELPFAERFSSVEVPFADRLAKVNVPFIDKLPQPIEAVDAYFGFMSNGIETNRAFAEKVWSRLAEAPEAVVVPVKKAAPKSTAKKTTAKKAPIAKKTAAEKA